MNQIDINSDVGESFGRYNLGFDEEIIKRVTSINVACGFHAGDPCVMEKTVALAARYGVAVGAHPGFPDMMGFGRRAMTLSSEEIKSYVKYQVGALHAFTVSHGIKLNHVKAHGALYNMSAVDYTVARAVADAVREVDDGLIFLALANSEMTKAGRDAGLTVANEVFADRAYNKDGTLVDRSKAGAMITDIEQCAKRIVGIISEGKVKAISGEDVYLQAHSVCVHGDTPEAVAFVDGIIKALSDRKIKPTALANMSF